MDDRSAQTGSMPGAFDAVLDRAGRLAPIVAGALRNPTLRAQRQHERAVELAARRSHWWYPVALVLGFLAVVYSALSLDQRSSAALVWPTSGAQFVQVGDSVGADGYRRTLVIVAGGLNRRSGSLVAEALDPSIGGSDSRVFSLVYGNGIFDEDIQEKFDDLYEQWSPRRLVLVGSSMGGDVVLGIAAHFQQTYADPNRYFSRATAPVLSAIYLDCTPLGTSDVRVEARTRADFITGLTESVGVEGGAGTRLVAELLATQSQWSSGDWPNLHIRPGDLAYKWREVWRDKLNSSGVSTQLVKDQYGVIRRFDADRVFGSLSPDTRIVFLRPTQALDDRTIDVQAVQDRLLVLADTYQLDVTVLAIDGGSHASAVRDADVYNAVITDYQRGELTGGLPGAFR
jgi:pimeloyl-ACP methyl ester carboxylesterase